MEISIVHLRYKTREILASLENNESVSVLYHGKVKGILSPIRSDENQKVSDHSFFGMNKETGLSVEEEMKQIRGPRYDL